MNVAVLGGKGRDSDEDRKFVFRLLDECAARYPLCSFVTTMTNIGVGYFVKEKCLEQTNGKYRHQLVEVSVRLMGADLLSPDERNTVLLARNATLFKLGDVFYYLANRERRGMMEELIQKRVSPSNRPYKIFLPGEELQLI